MSRAATDPRPHSTLLGLFGLLTAGIFSAGPAHAQGYSTDLELVRPVFSHQGLPGIDTPVMAAQPTMRGGIMHPSLSHIQI